MIEQSDSVFDAESTGSAVGTHADSTDFPETRPGTVVSKAKSPSPTKGLKLTVPVAALQAHEVLHAWAEALRRDPALYIPSPGEVLGSTTLQNEDRIAPAASSAYDPDDRCGTSHDEADVLREQVARLSNELTVARASLDQVNVELAATADGQLEIVLAELAAAQREALQAKRAREIQAANHAVLTARLEESLAAYKAETEKLTKRAKFGTAIYRILERLPGHVLDPRTQILKGPKEIEILRYFDAARAVFPGATGAFRAVVWTALRPSAPEPAKPQSWFNFLRRRRDTTGRK